MEIYLRIYYNKRKDNWVLLLSLAQMAYNNKELVIIGITLYYANYGKHLYFFNWVLLTAINTEEAIKIAEIIKETHEELQENLKKL